MSTEDRKAYPIPPELFDALLKAIRETVRAEMRAEFEARRRASTGWQAVSFAYDVPDTFNGQPI